ncbi:hypothetical protein VNO77_18990 [Canavalia gladiata]|uniref:Uncharacterized protein n=1 Tax=Canavalia gladiata TaxID=3824 RepID=A0AAN9LQJ1_CANGL
MFETEALVFISLSFVKEKTPGIFELSPNVIINAKDVELRFLRSTEDSHAKIAVQEFNRLSCSELDLKIKNSHGSPAQTVAGGNAHFQLFVLLGWRKVTLTYELNNRFSYDPSILLDLSYSLSLVGSEIDNHLAFPSFSSLLDPKVTIEHERNKLKRKNNRVFLIVQSSLELAIVLFEKAKQMGLMDKGCVGYARWGCWPF